MSNNFIIAPGNNLNVCIDKQLYGHHKNLLAGWKPGDRVIYYVDQSFAGYGTVASAPYVDHTRVWPDGVYPHRIKVTPTVVLPRSAWIPLDDHLRGRFQESMGRYWVFAIRGARPIPAGIASHVLRLISSKGSSTLEEPAEEFKAVQEEAQSQLMKREHERPSVPKTTVTEEAEEEPIAPNEAQSHDRTQWYLIKLGRALGCDVWIARNDQNKSYKGEAFSDLCLKRLPNLGFDSATSRIIELIDVLWLQSNVIQCAFEVEHTTSIYSGILRLGDLVASQPHIKIKLFIVAPNERKHQVVSQLNRPVFKGLKDLCKYIPYDKLESTLAKIEDFQGYLQVGLVEKIAESCAQDANG